MVEGDGYAVANVDALAEGPGFRKIRRALGVTAFGVNAIEIPPGFQTGRHFHERAGGALLRAPRPDRDPHERRDRARARPGRARARGRLDGPADQERRRRAGASTWSRAARTATWAATASCPRARRTASAPRAQPADLYGGRRDRGRRAGRLPGLPGRQPWNQRVDGLPGAPELGRHRALDRRGRAHARGLRLGPLPGRADRDPVRDGAGAASGGCACSFDYADESDRGRYPIPRRVPIEGGRGSDGDRHVIVVDRARCRLYELFDAHPLDGGARWHAGSGAIFNLRSNRLRPRGWTSADAAGLPILPGLARYPEVRRGRDRPRAPLHGVRDAPRLHLPGAPFRVEPHRTRPARHGPATAAEARLRHLAASRASRESS